jgi:hypothetical protein
MKTTSSIKCLPIRLMLSEWRSAHKLAMRIQEAAHKKFIKFNRLADHFRCFGATCEVVNIWESRFRPLSANVGSWPIVSVVEVKSLFNYRRQGRQTVPYAWDSLLGTFDLSLRLAPTSNSRSGMTRHPSISGGRLQVSN